MKTNINPSIKSTALGIGVCIILVEMVLIFYLASRFPIIPVRMIPPSYSEVNPISDPIDCLIKLNGQTQVYEQAANFDHSLKTTLFYTEKQIFLEAYREKFRNSPFFSRVRIGIIGYNQKEMSEIKSRYVFLRDSLDEVKYIRQLVQYCNLQRN